MSKWIKTAGLLAAAGLVYSAGIEPYCIGTEKVEILCPRLPRAFDGYTIVQVSDLHMRQMGRRERSIVRAIQSIDEPDIVVLTGDLIHTTAGIEPFLEIARTLRARDGVFAVFGNSEHKNGVDPLAFGRRLSSAGVTCLPNLNVKIERGDAVFYVAGVDDPASGYDDLDRALEGIDVNAFVLLLMHSPDPIAFAASRGIDVVLSGHTHGGQIKLPLVGAPLTHSWHGTRMNSGYYSGESLQKVIGARPGRTRLYVTRGLGVSGLALRFLCPPELSIITLRSFAV